MKTFFTLIFAFIFFSLNAQVLTENSATSEKATIFLLPRNIVPMENQIKRGPPVIGMMGRSIMINFENERMFILKTIFIPKSGSSEKIQTVYDISDGIVREVDHTLKYEININKEDKNKSSISFSGEVDNIENWDFEFTTRSKNDIKNIDFLELIEARGYKVVMDMNQK